MILSRNWHFAVAFILALGVASPFAIPSAQAKAPVIVSSIPDFVLNTLTINGSNLGPGAASVLLGASGPLTVVAQTPTQLVVALPPGLASGDYVLSVQIGNGNGNSDESVATIGEVGPQGPEGLKGDTGATGLQGLKGDKGDTGATGLQGLKGDKGDTGATGLQGLKGDKGDIGATGAPGPAGGANGAKTVVSGRVDSNGGWISGANWWSYLQQVRTWVPIGQYMQYYVALQSMIDASKPPPVCTVIAHPPAGQIFMVPNRQAWIEYDSPIYSEELGSWAVGFNFCYSWATKYMEPEAMRTEFSFICVQE
jgi:hypothetical protein